ncbi:NfeD family protein [Candidatus Synchoanobacter obligatus]|uniref:Nodulation protein NfeD n=1 Tax=Candidatus Synchoanobacter obligatus TaxID=2919597 RepID=A0ABT1L5H7_9GAMM|nr:nodulation protein NfeD [Candidatus Synchoanobacter obligatus]MCP8352421.1 nodulation protein NfeD [Candidatus Synchoanobacter obligatus]
MNKRKTQFYLRILLATFLASMVYATPKILQVTINQAITPPAFEYLASGLEAANNEGYDAVILQLDTPGGLYTTTRSFGQAILASPVPVITYVSPQGARAASAGTFILYASHLAAMAPGTHLGSATPVSLGPNNEKKDDAVTNKIMEDSTAYIRSLAQYHDRNEDFAIDAVSTAVSLTAQEALSADAIEIIASDATDLLQQAHNKRVRMQNGFLTLNLKDAKVINHAPTLKQRILFAITDPNITYLLLMAGIYGLMIELFNPGSLIPGVIGAVCLLIAAYSLQILPINYAGLGLILLGTGFLVAESFIPSFGILGFAGVIALAVGSFFLFDGIHWAMPSVWVILSIVAALSIGLLTLIKINLRTYRRAPVSGSERLIGQTAIVTEVHEHDYAIRVDGEVWSAISETSVRLHQYVIVTHIHGVVATIQPSGE